MTNHIHLLPDTLANQIAAGEVIQRPASVVKELLENSIDAGSSNIKVVIKDAGKALIQVIDDGMGMSEVDARMSLEKHATSKISTVDDLFNIHTMGFRGEALPSIAAVSQLVIETRTPDEELGTCLTVAGTTVKSQEPISTPQGTKISVKNLFFNVPARRNFLKSTPVETKHIIDELQRIALANPEVSFSLYQNEQETYRLPATDKLSHRIVHLFGDAYKKQLVPCRESTNLIQIQGYVGKPTYAKKTRGEQFFFVNKRFIKSPYLNHAVKKTFERLLLQDAFPFYVLFIDIDPAHIDVNVHPTKTQIKFEDEHMIYSVLTSAIRQSLTVHHIVPALDFEQDVNFDPSSLQKSFITDKPSSIAEKNYAQFKSADDSYQTSNQDWEKLFKRLQEDDTLPKEDQQVRDLAHPMATEKTLVEPIAFDQESKATNSKIQLHTRYILTSVKSGLLLIDQSAAHERILYEKYLQALENQSSTAQQMLFPSHITINPADFSLLQEYKKEFLALGFAIESLGKNSIIISGCPQEAIHYNPKQLIESVLEQIKWNQEHLTLSIRENLACSLAKRSCIQQGRKLMDTEMDTLVDQLFACQHANYTPDGTKTWIVIQLEELANFLKN